MPGHNESAGKMKSAKTTNGYVTDCILSFNS
nr:hypothetical protein [Paenibacillus sp. CGMCC 1.16610]